jgi:hypothetical protein
MDLRVGPSNMHWNYRSPFRKKKPLIYPVPRSPSLLRRRQPYPAPPPTPTTLSGAASTPTPARLSAAYSSAGLIGAQPLLAPGTRPRSVSSLARNGSSATAPGTENPQAFSVAAHREPTPPPPSVPVPRRPPIPRSFPVKSTLMASWVCLPQRPDAFPFP